jgi:hypothetical protein
MKIQIADATATQLSNFARIHHGLDDVAPTKGREHIVARLAAVGFTEDAIEVPDPHPAPVPAQTHPAAAPSGNKRRMVKITILEQDIPGSTEGKEPVKVSVNGSAMYIPRGKPVDIPYEYFHALQNASYRQFDLPPDAYTPLGEARDVPRFPITVHQIDPEPVKQAA